LSRRTFPRGARYPVAFLRQEISMLGTILVVLLILWLLGAFPRSGAYNANWGYAPVGTGTIILIILLVLVLAGQI
jgi:hypothetical protein